MRLTSLRKATAEQLAGAAVPNLSIANNTFTVKLDDNKKVVSSIDDEGKIYVDVHIVDANLNLSKMYYKDKFSNDEDKWVAPTCYSDDNVKPSDMSEAKQSEFCGSCAHNVWGSAISETGAKIKACRDYWKLAVVVPKFSDKQLFQLRIPGGSLKAWLAYNAKFAEFEVGGRDGHAGDVLTRLAFEPGKQGILEFEPVAMATDEQTAYLTLVNAKGLANNLVGQGVVGAPALPAPSSSGQPKITHRPSSQAISTGEGAAAKAAREARSAQEEAYTVAADEGTIDEPVAVEEPAVEEDIEARIRKQVMAEMQEQANQKAKLAQAEAAKSAMQPKKTVDLGVAKIAKPASSDTMINLKSKAGMEGLRLAKGGVAQGTKVVAPAAQPASKSTVAGLMKAKAAAVDAEAEITPPPAKVLEPKKPAGIPGAAQLPDALQSLLNNVMGV